MRNKISLKARKWLLKSIKIQYQIANWKEKIKILERFLATTGYERKHAINLLNKTVISVPRKTRLSTNKYDETIREALIIIWHTANKICSKRLVPFLLELINVLESQLDCM